MDVSIIIPVEDATDLDATLQGILAQSYDDGAVEVIVVAYGENHDTLLIPDIGTVSRFSIARTTPYAARNLGAAKARGGLLLFTEAGMVPDPGWVRAHVARLGAGVSVTVGDVAPARETRLGRLFASYERVRDAWVFSCPEWPYYFGRPKNMGIRRERFDSHGPFVEVQRGADSKFVQKVARELSCDEIALVPDGIVRQLSIQGILGAYADRFGHAHALARFDSSHAAPISLGRRVALFRETVARHALGPVDAAALVLLLTVGIWVFRFGGFAASVFARRQT